MAARFAMPSGDGSANKRRCKRASSIACSWRCMTTFSIEQIALSCALKRAMRKASGIFEASFLPPAAEREADRATRLALRLQLGVPVEVIEPALVQIVRRKAPPVARP